MVQVGSRPLKQSTNADRYILPAGIANSVMSVSHSSLGLSAWKLRFTTSATAGVISPL